MAGGHQFAGFIEWLVPRWPSFLIGSGLLFFAVACVSDLPEEALYIGPALMLAGLIIRFLHDRPS
jgi:hypothetical protein